MHTLNTFPIDTCAIGLIDHRPWVAMPAVPTAPEAGEAANRRRNGVGLGQRVQRDSAHKVCS